MSGGLIMTWGHVFVPKVYMQRLDIPYQEFGDYVPDPDPAPAVHKQYSTNQRVAAERQTGGKTQSNQRRGWRHQAEQLPPMEARASSGRLDVIRYRADTQPIITDPASIFLSRKSRNINMTTLVADRRRKSPQKSRRRRRRSCSTASTRGLQCGRRRRTMPTKWPSFECVGSTRQIRLPRSFDMSCLGFKRLWSQTQNARHCEIATADLGTLFPIGSDVSMQHRSNTSRLCNKCSPVNPSNSSTLKANPPRRSVEHVELMIEPKL